MCRLLVMVVVLGVGCMGPSPTGAPTDVSPAVTPAEPPAIAREQLFFSGRDEGGPVLAALILQREPRPAGAVLEAKGFVALGGVLRSPFYERAELPSWPGDEVPAALEAWRSARTGAPMRIEWGGAEGLGAMVRTPGAALEIRLREATPAGETLGPHGSVSWSAGPATLTVDGKEISGVGAVETLRGSIANPVFGRFEMWLLAPTPGSLVLGRVRFGKQGTSLRVDSKGRGGPGHFDVLVTGQQRHEPTGFDLPTAWTLPGDGLALTRSGRFDPVVGRSPSGGPAVYDIGLARSEDGGAAALVFHLQDAPGR
jgi:hypothetical protein